MKSGTGLFEVSTVAGEFVRKTRNIKCEGIKGLAKTLGCIRHLSDLDCSRGELRHTVWSASGGGIIREYPSRCRDGKPNFSKSLELVQPVTTS